MKTVKAAYDYIIAGAGCAGLSLLARMAVSKEFSKKKILLVDREEKNRNDRTWCFWEQNEGFFEPVVYRKWDHLWFHSSDFSKHFEIRPYEYKMIRGIDFYRHCLNLIRDAGNIEMQYDEIQSLESDQSETAIILNDQKINCDYIFSSIAPRTPPAKNAHHLLQHFHGWVVDMPQPVFTPGEATLMDFRVGQSHGVTFVYVMPFSETRALVEYTLFSAELLPIEKYEQGLSDYLSRFYPGISYSIAEKEFGVIPMTSQKCSTGHHHLVNIGTAGGQTKPSTGYTFQFIQKDSDTIISNLVNGIQPEKGRKSSRKFQFYDNIMLNVLATRKMSGSKLFTSLFQKNSIRHIFSFLDNESSMGTDLSVISSLPVWPFLKAGIEETVKK